MKNLKGFKCIYNELERKGSMAYAEQKRATSSSPLQRKLPLPSSQQQQQQQQTVKSPTNSPPASPKNISKPANNDSNSTTLKNNSTNMNRSKLSRSSDLSLTNPLTTTAHSFPSVNQSANETMIMRYQTIQRYKTNFEILKPATVIAEEWKNLDKNQKDRLALGGPKALVLVSKSSTPNKHIQIIQT